MKDELIPPTGETAPVASPGQASLPYHILVVEDDLLARQLSTSMLIDAGYEVDATQDGGIAWDALQFRKYDLVITDNRLPKMSGIELLKKLRGAGMTLPVILATGVAPKEEFPRKPSIQPDATLVKPYSLADFLETVKRVLCGAEPVVAQRAAT